MTGDQLQTALAWLGWDEGELSRRIGVHDALDEYAAGPRPVHGGTAAYIRLCMSLANNLGSIPRHQPEAVMGDHR